MHWACSQHPGAFLGALGMFTPPQSFAGVHWACSHHPGALLGCVWHCHRRQNDPHTSRGIETADRYQWLAALFGGNGGIYQIWNPCARPCVCACMCVSTCVCLRVCARPCVFTCVCVPACLCQALCVCLHVCVPACV